MGRWTQMSAHDQGTAAVRLAVVAIVGTTILAVVSSLTMWSLIGTAEENSARVVSAAKARAELRALHELEVTARSGDTIDEDTLANGGTRLRIHFADAVAVLAPGRQAEAGQLLDAHLADLGSTEPMGAARSDERTAALEELLDDAELLAEESAAAASTQARTGTAVSASLALLGVTALMLILLRITRRTLTSSLGERFNRRFEAIIRNSPDFVFVIEADGRASYVSPAAERVAGVGTIGHVEDLIAMMDPADAELIRSYVADPALATGPATFNVTTPDGLTRKIELVLSDQRDNEALGALVVTGRDISDRVALEERLAAQAHQDELTGLPNRRALNSGLGAALARAARSTDDVALLLLDLDGFKGVNDTLGHPVGDALLVEVADRLAESSRSDEVVARLGGDEFAVILEGVSGPLEAMRAAERLAAVLATPFEIDGQLLALGVSGGLAFAGDDRDQDALLRRADIALYEAKQRGRGRVEVFEPAMEDLLIGEVRLQREIEAGFRNGEFTLAYQPVLTVGGQDTVGFEALMRWESPTLGTVPPITFIPVCERSGLIIELGRWALRDACSQLVQFQQDSGRPDLTMSVNVSVVQLGDTAFVPDLREILATTGVEPTRLQLEVTESVIAERVEGLVMKLQEIRAMGVRVALDDFGTGYSSMGQLQMLPVDCIKIDQSFIAALRGDDERAALVVNALVELGRALGLQVIAEGVEELEQLTALIGPQCDLAQGFLLAHPMMPEDVRAYLESGTPAPSPAPPHL